MANNSRTDATGLPQGLSPDALDSLTGLTTVLTRLRSTIQSSGTGGISGATPGASGATPSGGGAGGGGGVATSSTGPLSLKDVPSATDGLKHKLQKARLQVRDLPDMGRTMEEQEHEISRLEKRIQLQRQVLETLRNGGQLLVSSGAAEDVPMANGGGA